MERSSDSRYPLACSSCKKGKRQCDKLLPSCSRCKRINRVCEYPPVSTSSPVPPHTAARVSDRASTQSCVRCRVHKRKCDRLIPSCSLCVRLRTNCEYESNASDLLLALPSTQEGNQNSESSDMALDLSLVSGLEVPFDPPIRYRPYMPALLRFFLRSVASSPNIAITDSLTSHLHSKWIQVAMLDPCLFHATMFSASAALDHLNQRANNTITIYHQTCAIRLLNQRLNKEPPMLNYGTLGSVIPMILYNMVVLDRASAIAHQKGLIKMLLLTPKPVRDGIGPLLGVIKLIMFSLSCVFDMPPVWSCLISGSVLPNAILRNLVASISFHGKGYIFEKKTLDAILDVYEATSQLDHLDHADSASISEIVDRMLSAKRGDVLDSILTKPEPSSTVDRVNICCQLCSLIFWNLLRGRRPPEVGVWTTNAEEIKLLLEMMVKIESQYWVENSPEALTWILFTGAAVSANEKDRGKFIEVGGACLAAIDTDSLSMVRQGWRYYGLLRRLAGLS